MLDLGAMHRDAVPRCSRTRPTVPRPPGSTGIRGRSSPRPLRPSRCACAATSSRTTRFASSRRRSTSRSVERTRDLDESLEELTRADEARKLLLERLVSAQEDERRRIAGDIHDDSIQVITAAYLRVDLIRKTLGDDAHSDSLAKLDEALRASIERLGHMIFELRPTMLDTAGLAATIQEHLNQWTQQTGATHTLSTRLEREPAPLVHTTLYRIAAEALANVRKHARATPRQRRPRPGGERIPAPGRRRRRRDPHAVPACAERTLRHLDDGGARGDGRWLVPGRDQRPGPRDDRDRLDAQQRPSRGPVGSPRREPTRSRRCSRSAF